MSTQSIVERITVLRDEVLDTATQGQDDVPGQVVFDAILRRLEGKGGPAATDATLKEQLSRQLAWGGAQAAVLAETDLVCRRLFAAVKRSFPSPEEASQILSVASEVSSAAARFVSLASVSRAQIERAAQLREEMAQERLKKALAGQQQELRRLTKG
jgi:hypothetical protein